jgi:hypothetical protein
MTRRDAFWAIGMAIAVTVSWSRNTSIYWAVAHALLGWFYVLYVALCT